VSNDIVDRIRSLRYVHIPPASALFEESAQEIEKLRSQVRFYEKVVQSGDVATLTTAEREAVEYFAAFHASPRAGDAKSAATLRGLLERLA